jgi:predicted dehydrogenase
MSKIKIGLIGVGKLGAMHANSLSQNPETELTGVFDADAQRTQEIADKFHCAAFASLTELLTHVEAVGIIVPTTLHHRVTLQALAAGKPVFVEKPIAGSITEAEEMVQLALKKNIALQVGHIERFNPAIRALDGRPLKPMFIESHRLAPFDPRGTDVAVVLDLMIHDIDIILSIVQSEVTDLHANGVAVVSDEVDIANARITFANGCVANVTASRISQRKMRKMRLFQRDAYISIDFLQRLTEVFQLIEDENGQPSTVVLGQIEKGAHKRNIIYEQAPIPEGDAMTAEWNSFIHAIRQNVRPIVSGEDGLKALKIAQEITRVISI